MAPFEDIINVPSSRWAPASTTTHPSHPHHLIQWKSSCPDEGSLSIGTKNKANLSVSTTTDSRQTRLLLATSGATQPLQKISLSSGKVVPLDSPPPTTSSPEKWPTSPIASQDLTYPTTFMYGTVLFCIGEYKTTEMSHWAPPNISLYQYEKSDHPL